MPLHPLEPDDLARSADWIAAHQRADGGIPWFGDSHLDPWNHVHCAMALATAGRWEEAKAAFRHLTATQLPEGAWPSLATPDEVLDGTRDSNHAAYLASGLW